MRRITIMLVVAAALIAGTVAPAAPAAPAVADGGCWICNSIG
jgi:hypothetical protein